MFLGKSPDINLKSSGDFAASTRNGVLQSFDGTLNLKGDISHTTNLHLRLRNGKAFDPDLHLPKPTDKTIVQFARFVPLTQEAIIIDLTARHASAGNRRRAVSQLQFERLEQGINPDQVVVSVQNGRKIFRGKSEITHGSGSSVTVAVGKGTIGDFDVDIV